MKKTQPPDPNLEMQCLEPLTPLLYEGFEAATEVACQYFEVRDKRVDPALFPEIVRYEMKEFLTDRGQVVEDLSREEIGHNGLCIIFGARRIRMWKADDERLPAPGLSHARRDFVNQQLGLFDDAGSLRAVERNLVILWNVDSSYRLQQLHLVCPKWASNDGLKAEAYWTRPIEHPAVAPPAWVRKEVPNAPVKDLPIRVASDDARQARHAT